MWIKLEDGTALNFDKVISLGIEENPDGAFEVGAFIEDGDLYVVKESDNEAEAQAYVDMLVDTLNGEKPVDYAFNWLKARKNAKATRKVETAEKPVDEDLIDGVPL